MEPQNCFFLLSWVLVSSNGVKETKQTSGSKVLRICPLSLLQAYWGVQPRVTQQCGGGRQSRGREPAVPPSFCGGRSYRRCQSPSPSSLPRAEPVLTRIKENRKRIISPSFDNIKYDNFEIEEYPLAAQGFDWELWCRYLNPPKAWWKLENSTAPIR